MARDDQERITEQLILLVLTFAFDQTPELGEMDLWYAISKVHTLPRTTWINLCANGSFGLNFSKASRMMLKDIVWAALL